MSDAITLGWEALAALPHKELNRVKPEYLKKYLPEHKPDKMEELPLSVL